jgi:hypothetical protein
MMFLRVTVTLDGSKDANSYPEAISLHAKPAGWAACKDFLTCQKQENHIDISNYSL